MEQRKTTDETLFILGLINNFGSWAHRYEYIETLSELCVYLLDFPIEEKNRDNEIMWGQNMLDKINKHGTLDESDMEGAKFKIGDWVVANKDEHGAGIICGIYKKDDKFRYGIMFGFIGRIVMDESDIKQAND